MESNIPRLVLGPIIGKVTSDTARISIELEHSQEVECALISRRDGSRKICRKVPNRGFPTIFAFSELDPQTTYKVSLPQLTEDVYSSFRTLRQEGDQPGKFNIAVVSCNEITQAKKKTPIHDLWLDLSKRTKNLDYLFHVGDQCYMDMGDENNKDTPYQKCRAILEGLPMDEWMGTMDIILEILRSHYRLTWSHRPTATVLANIPNLMILDDHEVRDDWGWRKEDYDPNTEKWDYFYGQLARRVYYEYQRQLREDIDWENLERLEQEYYYEILNGVGVVFVEYRGSRTWFREDKVEDLQLGIRQKEWIKGLFCPQGIFDQKNVESVLFISPLPPVYLSGIVVVPAVLFEDDAKEQWTVSNSRELVHLLDLLREWKMRRFGREVTILGGDVHVGVHTKIFYDNKPLFHQFTTSAINNVMTNRNQFFAVKLALAMSDELDYKYSYEHFKVTQRNNYGLVQMENKHGFETVKCTLIESTADGVKPEKRGVTNQDTKKKKNPCWFFCSG